MRCYLPLSVVVLAMFSLPAIAQTGLLLGDPEAGHDFARKTCSNCHVIEPGEHGKSPAGSPAFQDVADDPAVTEAALRVFFNSPHQNMPNLILTTPQSDNVIAYILSLK